MARSGDTQKAHNAASNAAWEITNSCVKEVKSAVDNGEDFDDALHEAVDSALIYIADQYVCVWGLRDGGEDAISDMGAKTWQDALAAQAYINLRAAVEHELR